MSFEVLAVSPGVGVPYWHPMRTGRKQMTMRHTAGGNAIDQHGDTTQKVSHQAVAEVAAKAGTPIHTVKAGNGDVVLTFEHGEHDPTAKWVWVDGRPVFIFPGDVKRLVAFLTSGGE